MWRPKEINWLSNQLGTSPPVNRDLHEDSQDLHVSQMCFLPKNIQENKKKGIICSECICGFCSDKLADTFLCYPPLCSHFRKDIVLQKHFNAVVVCSGWQLFTSNIRSN